MNDNNTTTTDSEDMEKILEWYKQETKYTRNNTCNFFNCERRLIIGLTNRKDYVESYDNESTGYCATHAIAIIRALSEVMK